MTSPIANFSGLSSGVQWNDIVESIVAAEEARNVTPISNRLELRGRQQEAWTKFRSLVDTLNEKARAVRIAGFGGFRSTVPTSPTSGQTLFGASASTLATPGRYRVEVQQLAETAKIGGRAVADRTAALGYTGDFAINGTSIAIEATDSLTAIRDKINAANTGATPTGVSASISNDGPNGGRLILTRGTAGSDGITLTDGTGGMARELGFVDSRSRLASSTTDAIAAALGIAVSPPPATIRVDGRVITVDLATESLASIVAKINAAGGQAGTEEVTFGNESRFQLVVDGNVTADPGDPNSQAVLDALGMMAGTTGTVRQVSATGVYTDGVGGTATGSTELAGLQLDGTSVGLSVGDAINVRGTRGDGSTFTVGLVVQAGDTMDDLLARLNDPVTGLGAGARPATALMGSDGRIRVADSEGGASRLGLSFEVVRADGSTGSMGSTSVETAGRERQLQEGRDAIIRVDGTEYVRSTNTITDVISNVTLSLATAEAGTEVELDISRDLDGAAEAMQELVTAYNEVRSFFDEQRQLDAPLYGNSLVRGVVDSFTAALRTEATGNTTYSRATLTGVTLDRNGGLTFDASKFKEALGAAPAEIEALFGFTGIGGAFVTATDKATAFGTGTISNQLNSILESTQRLQKQESDARQRLEDRRAALVEQFTQMEAALSRLNAQGSALAGLISSAQSSR